MPVRYQQRCVKCRKNMVPMYSAKQFPICASCQLAEISGPISNKTMAKFFDIPLEFYQQSQFLRSIKSQYMRFGSLTANQKEAFIKVVKELKNPKKTPRTTTNLPGEISRATGAEDDASLREKLIKALDHVLLKDTKSKRRDLLELITDLKAQPITHVHLKHAIDELTRPSRGRPRIMLMTTSELKDVLDRLAGAR